jgi:hypothetical protein
MSSDKTLEQPAPTAAPAEMIEQIGELISEFEGAVISASHDLAGRMEQKRADELKDELKAAVAALAAAPVGLDAKAATWQPISTAPKDGTQMILTNGAVVAQGWWEHQEPYSREQRDIDGHYIDQQEHDGFDGWLDCEGGMQPDPTHWQPLPAAPQAQAAPPATEVQP